MQCNILKDKKSMKTTRFQKGIQSEKHVPKFKLINFFLTRLSGLISLNTNFFFLLGIAVGLKEREREVMPRLEHVI